MGFADGKTTGYALQLLEPRGVLFTAPSTSVYSGMIIGEHSRDNDLEVSWFFLCLPLCLPIHALLRGHTPGLER